MPHVAGPVGQFSHRDSVRSDLSELSQCGNGRTRRQPILLRVAGSKSLPLVQHTPNRNTVQPNSLTLTLKSVGTTVGRKRDME
jgi:hypothetical protein